jgi:exodeoxyribonuclease VII small subunit
MSAKNEKNEPDLESAMKRISEIVAAMEDGGLPLEKLIDQYEEGIGLVKTCREKLDSAEKRIQLITRTAGGGAELSPFDEES